MLPKRENSRSNFASSVAVLASAQTKRALLAPASAARRVAWATRSGEMSSPTTSPVGATACAIAMVVAPPPQPRSTTRSSGLNAARLSSALPIGAIIPSNESRLESQRCPISLAQSSRVESCSCVRDVSVITVPGLVYPRTVCCAQFTMALAGIAPDCLAISFPPANRIMVGIERIA